MTAVHEGPAGDLFVGLDMGATDIKATVSDGAGVILVQDCEKVLSLSSEGPRTTVQQIGLAASKIIERAGRDWAQVRAVGLCTPGPATPEGKLSRSPNLNHAEWEGFEIAREVAIQVGRSVVYTNDGNAAGYWEYHRRFADQNDKLLAAITLGTGLGGAMVWGGDLLGGAHGCGGEFGHLRLPTHALSPDGDVPICGCGKSACAEAYASVTALDYFLRKALRHPQHSRHPLHQIPDTGKGRALKLLTLAQQGDALAQTLFDEQADAVGYLLLQLSNCFDPDVYVIGGGITASSPAFRQRYLARVQAVFLRETFPIVADGMQIEFASDEDFSGCRGTALLARQSARV